MLTKELNPNSIRDLLMQRAIQARRPLSATFELTYRCNFRCPMCYIRMTDEQAKPFGRLRTVEEWIDMAKQARDAGVLCLTLTGGECTQYPGFETLYEAISKMGFRISLMTNAGHYSETLKALFRAYPPNSVSVSLYGGSNETYERVTGLKNGLDRVTENLRFFREIGVPFSLSFTMIRQNVLDYPRVGEIARMFGIPYYYSSDMTKHHFDPVFSNVERCALTTAERICVIRHSAREVERAMEAAREAERELDGFSMPESPKDVPTRHRYCNGSKTSFTIFWNGEMETCISLRGCRNVRPFETGLEAAWQALRESREEVFRMPAACAVCPNEGECARNCPGSRYEATGDPCEVSPNICRYTWLSQKLPKNGGLPETEAQTDCDKKF